MHALRVLALVAPGRHGNAAVGYAQSLGETEAIELTVVAIAPQASGPRCGTSILDYNAAVAQAAREDLARARARLGELATYAVLPARTAQALSDFAASGR